MTRHVDTIIVGQGLAGSALAWHLHWLGQSLLIFDRGEPNTASRVSAGVMTPVTGRRQVRSPAFDSDWESARAFYRRFESETGASVFRETQAIRLFSSEEEEADFRQRSGLSQEEATWCEALQSGGQEFRGCRVVPSGRLNVARYLRTTEAHFRQREEFIQEGLSDATDLIVTGKQVHVPRKDVTAERLVYCTGFNTTGFFPDVPNNPSRGDILNISSEGYQRSEVIHRGIWIAPESDGTLTVGATYDWNHHEPEPTETGRAELLERLGELLVGDITVREHRAGVRPTMKDYEPVLGHHHQYSPLWILNGLGSKGALRAPSLAAELAQAMSQGTGIATQHNCARLAEVLQQSGQQPLTQVAQKLVGDVVKSGETVIDATVGNGFDTSFLSRLVGESGTVVGFDIQQQAIDSTRRRLQANGLGNVRLIRGGHEKLFATAAAEVALSIRSVAAVMFNLGYLPRADKHITTSAETTVPAVRQALEVLRPGGIVTILVYRGHGNGPEEYRAVVNILASVGDDYDVSRIDSVPARETAPVLFAVRKHAG